MERMVAPVIEAIWRKVVESFSTKVVEQVADGALNSVNNVTDFGLIFENLQKNLRALSAKEADVEDEITNRERSGRKKRKREVKEWLEQVESIKQKVVELGSQIDSEGFVTRLIAGGEAAQLDEQVKELVDQSRNFSKLVLDVCGTRGETLLTNGMVGSAFDENLERILRLLKRREVESIGVYGMGGVGKTTLAKHIHNRLLQQGDVFWITVSQEFTIRSLQNKIARFLRVKLEDEDEEDIRAATLNRVLSRKKNVLLILDDVWENIDLLRVGCPVSMECCRLIITTRSAGVCGQIGCQEVIQVGILKEGEAWKLFKERFGNDRELDPEVERIAKSMVKLCGGLPLGIITVAGSMKGKAATKATWEDAHIELKERVVRKDSMSKDKVFEILKYSFEWLKGQDHNNGFNMIQRCFLYCSLYPEDHEIDRDHLVRELISDGLVSGRESRRARVTRGLSILDELVNVCLLEKCVDSYGTECVKMHDLIRDMALKICEGKYMVRVGENSLEGIINEEERTKSLEKVSYIYSRIWRIEDGASPNCPNLSTLLLRWNPWDCIPDSFFSKMQSLCTLDLFGNSEITKLPDSISDMTSLKALLLEGCENLEKVPYLGKMEALRELNLSGTAIKEAPRGLDQLLELEFLSLENAHNLEMIPSGLLQKLVRLQHVSIPFHIEVPMGGIQNLKLLEEFHGCLERVEDFNSFMRSGEGRRERDTWYTIIVGNPYGLCSAYSLHFEEKYIYENPPYKKNLGLCGCNLEEQRVLWQDTEYVMIIECEGPSISFLDHFSGLKTLEILVCNGIEWILRSDGQYSNTLEIISLAEMDNLKGVVMERPSTQLHIFSSLRELTIVECNKMRKVGLPSALPNLEEISIQSCEEIEEIFEEDEGRVGSIVATLPKLKVLSLSYLPRLKNEGLPLSRAPNLERIDIVSCEEIEEIFKEDEGRAASILTTLTKLKHLRLCRLPRWKNVGLSVSRVPNLELVNISECEEIEEIFKEDGGRVGSIVTTLPKLIGLELRNLPKLRKVGLAVSGVPYLQRIDIEDCEEMEEIVEEEEGIATLGLTTLTLPKLGKLKLRNLPKLRKVGLAVSGVPYLEEIDIRDCLEMEEIFEEDEGRVGSIVTTLPKLKALSLSCLPRLKNEGLPLSRAPNLERIDISSCEEIEEIFKEDEGRAASILTALTKLKQLRLCRLPRWKNVGLSVSRVPNLEWVNISECEEIEEIFKEDGGRVGSIVTTLPKLKGLELRNLPKLRKVGLAVSGVPYLKEIDIRDCREMEEIFEEEEGIATLGLTTLTLPKLEKLKLQGLPKLRKVGLAVSGVPYLQRIDIEDCEEMEEIFEEEEGIATLGLTTPTLPKLEGLFLEDLPRVKSVSKATIISNSMQFIVIRKCPILMKKLPVDFGDPTPPPTLQSIRVDREWWESLEWDIHPNLPRLLEPFLQLR